MKQDLQDTAAKSNVMSNDWGLDVSSHPPWFPLKTSSHALIEADTPFPLSTITFKSFDCIKPFALPARRFLRVRKTLLLKENVAFVVSSPHSSLLFILVKYFVKLCSFNQLAQIPLTITHSICYLLLHICKSYQQKTGAVFNYMLAFVCSHNKEKLILAQKRSKWQNILLLLYTLCLLSLPTTELRTLYYWFPS